MAGNYQIDMSQDGLLGEGTSCICRRGRVTGTGELVAIKFYKAPESSFSLVNHETCLMKHRRSVEVLMRLDGAFQRPDDRRLWSPQLANVKPAQLFMQLIDYSKDADGMPGRDAGDGELYLVTELAQYSLQDYIAKRKHMEAPPSKETVRSIAKSIVLVMAGLHAKGFVHMDIKPDNLMIFDGCLKLIDVDGCVEIGRKICQRDTSISFSPCYCAPEFAGFLLGGDKGASISAAPGLDVWSIGCTICELVKLSAIFGPAYHRFNECDKHRGRVFFMDWLTRLEQPPMPNAVEKFDPELVQFVTKHLLVCDHTQRSTCAEALDDPYLVVDDLHRTKSNPIRTV